MSREFGVELEHHRSAVVASADIDWADIVVIMDRKNWVQARRMSASKEKLVWLGTMDDVGRVEIPDPYQMDDAEAQRLLARIHECAVLFAERISASAQYSLKVNDVSSASAKVPPCREMDH
jgi:protein-tyrosine-phosphatase